MNIQTCPKGHYYDGDVTKVCPICEAQEKKQNSSPRPKSTALIQCGNCGNVLKEDDLYCRNCGTKRGEGAFRPEQNIKRMECLYGPPPVARTHICQGCGNEWKSRDTDRHCFRCGSTDILREDDITGWRSLLRETEEKERREKEEKMIGALLRIPEEREKIVRRAEKLRRNGRL